MRIYLDHAAATPVDPRVRERFLETLDRVPANPGSVHAAGRQARTVLEDARSEVAVALGIDPEAICFVSSGTEANNLVVQGLGPAERPVLLAPLEHASVLEPAATRGMHLWEVDRQGRACVREPGLAVGLVCLAHAQNEVGTLQPLDAAAELAARLGVPLHVDAAQTLGKVPLAGVLTRADTVTFSTHKAGGIRGQSVLVVRDRARAALRPLLRGGGQERGLRAGTESPALCAATALAVTLAVAETAARAAAMRAARDAFVTALGAGIAERLTTEPALPGTLMLAFSRLADGRVLLPALDLAGIEVSQGAACSSGSPLPPRVLRAMQIAEESARRCVRFSFGATTSTATATAAGAIVRGVVLRLRETPSQ